MKIEHKQCETTNCRTEIASMCGNKHFGGWIFPVFVGNVIVTNMIHTFAARKRSHLVELNNIHPTNAHAECAKCAYNSR